MASSPSTAVDLSRLPAPAIVEQLSFETILAGMVADLQVRFPGFTALVESDPAFKILEVAAYRELLLRADFNDRARSRLLAYAAGTDLDHVAAPFGVARLTGESDDALRSRVVLAPESYSVAGPADAYVFHARSASPDVADASAGSPSPGEVVVSVLAAAGDGAASAELLALVSAVVISSPVRPLTDHVTVQSAEILPFAISATVWTLTGPDRDLVLATGRAQLDAYLADSRKLGRDITDSGIKAALHCAGVQRVVLPGWADIVCTPAQAAHCTAITIAHGGFDA
jgi:phage-related baseplate assembly protein